ncbi:MAG TPA: acetylglutamate kinase [Thermoleophilia bacterium]|nr:acetylglutamate kinase [Thermoleophilia bacterium]
MTVRHQKTVKTLTEALPYIRRFQGATMVVKYGGAAMTSPQLADQFAQDIVLLKLVGMRPIIVHGGGPEISRHMSKLGMEPVFVDGQRVTDAATLEVAGMVLVGKINTEIVGLINGHGGTAVGLSGQDGRLIRAEVKEHRDLEGNLVDLGYVGSVKSIDTSVLELLADEMIPVVAGVGADEGGQVYNINADTVAGDLAAAVGAEKLVFLTDVGGILEQDGFEQDVVSECDLTYLGALQGAGAITGGMVPKVAAVRRALEAGVGSAHIIDGRVEHAVLLEVLTDAGCGTKVTR